MSINWLEHGALQAIRESLNASYIAGLTHGFYHYPARFSPTVVRAAIKHSTNPDDWILDPFMGGGTSVIESLALGRRIIGVDINSLAHFVAEVRTRPLSPRDTAAVGCWVSDASIFLSNPHLDSGGRMGIRNMPLSLDRFLNQAISTTADLGNRRQRMFARCLLLRLGQWALDGRESRVPKRSRLIAHMGILCKQMLNGLDQFVEATREAGVRKSQISSRRVLLNRTAVGLESDRRIQAIEPKPRLVITSPPYPGVHVLYHRWQHLGRRETSAPYQIAGLEDGHPGSHYTGGSRSSTGLTHYFGMIEQVFGSVREVVSPKAIVIQVVGFSDPRTQLRRYNRAMKNSGFEAIRNSSGRPVVLKRMVQNRKWYHRVKTGRDGGVERVLFHVPAPS